MQGSDTGLFQGISRAFVWRGSGKPRKSYIWSFPADIEPRIPQMKVTSITAWAVTITTPYSLGLGHL